MWNTLIIDIYSDPALHHGVCLSLAGSHCLWRGNLSEGNIEKPFGRNLRTYGFFFIRWERFKQLINEPALQHMMREEWKRYAKNQRLWIGHTPEFYNGERFMYNPWFKICICLILHFVQFSSFCWCWVQSSSCSLWPISQVYWSSR